MPNRPIHQLAVEGLLSARHVDVKDQDEIRIRCEEHEVAEDSLRSLIDTFGPLSQSLSVYLTK